CAHSTTCTKNPRSRRRRRASSRSCTPRWARSPSPSRRLSRQSSSAPAHRDGCLRTCFARTAAAVTPRIKVRRQLVVSSPIPGRPRACDFAPRVRTPGPEASELLCAWREFLVQRFSYGASFPASAQAPSFP
ncbi:hypothetical protein C8Q74DRAFT_1449364, partial [Fomes fomentarius]